MNQPRALTVLQVIPKLDAGGAEQTCVEIAQGLVQQGHRALVAGAPGRLVQDLADVGGDFIGFDGATKNPLAIVANGLWMARLARREAVDIIHARSRAPAWSARLAARRAGCRFVTTYHGIYNENSGPKRLYNSVMASGDRVIANSRFTAETIQARYGTAPEKLITIYRGMDPERFDPNRVTAAQAGAMRQSWGVADGQRVVLLPARFTRLKGHEILLEAAAALRERDGPAIVLVLLGAGAGDSDHAHRLQMRAGALGLENHVRFCPPTDNMPAAYAGADVTVMASTRAESFGRTMVEAQAMGCPVVAAGLGPVAETVLCPPLVSADQRTGWIIPPADPAALAGALTTALALSDGQRAAMAKRARAHVLQSFTTTAMVSATLDVYREMTASSPWSETRVRQVS